MFDASRFLLFLGAALILAITPGPGIFYVLARSLAGGRREGVLSAAGTFVGGLVHVTAAALGLSAVLAASALAFNLVRYAGAGYLIYLGVMMIRRRNENSVEPDVELRARRGPFVQGIITEILNPKTALFFLSFIPQFVSVP
jgi:threonine/homoserine/homoserine lactone efflux protein